MLTLDKIYQASFVLREVARKTDLIYAQKLSGDNEIYLKTENLQVTGSFKLRGAYYKISQLKEEQRSAGVIASSAGNHAQIAQILFIPVREYADGEQLLPIHKFLGVALRTQVDHGCG